MSAYIVNPYHLNLIVTFAADAMLLSTGRRFYAPRRVAAMLEAGQEPAEAIIARMLHEENVRSVNHRYRSATPPVAPVFATERLGAMSRPEMLARMHRHVACLMYQSCECHDWKESLAGQFLTALRDYITDELVAATLAKHAPDENVWEHTR